MASEKNSSSINKPTELTNPYHEPVLLKESVEALRVKAAGVYVDCTFGGGGHSRAILQQLSENGVLVGFDQDEHARQNLPDDKRLIFVPHNFRHMGRFLRLHKISQVDGILADLGVSSHQFDEGERGFSTGLMPTLICAWIAGNQPPRQPSLDSSLNSNCTKCWSNTGR
jgi:16S rRNA (cytosine(1402)-N(4))-methyltransferase